MRLLRTPDNKPILYQSNVSETSDGLTTSDNVPTLDSKSTILNSVLRNNWSSKFNFPWNRTLTLIAVAGLPDEGTDQENYELIPVECRDYLLEDGNKTFEANSDRCVPSASSSPKGPFTPIPIAETKRQKNVHGNQSIDSGGSSESLVWKLVKKRGSEDYTDISTLTRHGKSSRLTESNSKFSHLSKYTTDEHSNLQKSSEATIRNRTTTTFSENEMRTLNYDIRSNSETCPINCYKNVWNKDEEFKEVSKDCNGSTKKVNNIANDSSEMYDIQLTLNNNNTDSFSNCIVDIRKTGIAEEASTVMKQGYSEKNIFQKHTQVQNQLWETKCNYGESTNTRTISSEEFQVYLYNNRKSNETACQENNSCGSIDSNYIGSSCNNEQQLRHLLEMLNIKLSEKDLASLLSNERIKDDVTSKNNSYNNLNCTTDATTIEKLHESQSVAHSDAESFYWNNAFDSPILRNLQSKFEAEKDFYATSAHCVDLIKYIQNKLDELEQIMCTAKTLENMRKRVNLSKNCKNSYEQNIKVAYRDKTVRLLDTSNSSSVKNAGNNSICETKFDRKNSVTHTVQVYSLGSMETNVAINKSDKQVSSVKVDCLDCSVNCPAQDVVKDLQKRISELEHRINAQFEKPVKKEIETVNAENVVHDHEEPITSVSSLEKGDFGVNVPDQSDEFPESIVERGSPPLHGVSKGSQIEHLSPRRSITSSIQDDTPVRKSSAKLPSKDVSTTASLKSTSDGDSKRASMHSRSKGSSIQEDTPVHKSSVKLPSKDVSTTASLKSTSDGDSKRASMHSRSKGSSIQEDTPVHKSSVKLPSKDVSTTASLKSTSDGDSRRASIHSRSKGSSIQEDTPVHKSSVKLPSKDVSTTASLKSTSGRSKGSQVEHVSPRSITPSVKSSEKETSTKHECLASCHRKKDVGTMEGEDYIKPCPLDRCSIKRFSTGIKSIDHPKSRSTTTSLKDTTEDLQPISDHYSIEDLTEIIDKENVLEEIHEEPSLESLLEHDKSATATFKKSSGSQRSLESVQDDTDKYNTEDEVDDIEEINKNPFLEHEDTVEDLKDQPHSRAVSVATSLEQEYEEHECRATCHQKNRLGKADGDEGPDKVCPLAVCDKKRRSLVTDRTRRSETAATKSPSRLSKEHSRTSLKEHVEPVKKRSVDRSSEGLLKVVEADVAELPEIIVDPSQELAVVHPKSVDSRRSTMASVKSKTPSRSTIESAKSVISSPHKTPSRNTIESAKSVISSPHKTPSRNTIESAKSVISSPHKTPSRNTIESAKSVISSPHKTPSRNTIESAKSVISSPHKTPSRNTIESAKSVISSPHKTPSRNTIESAKSVIGSPRKSSSGSTKDRAEQRKQSSQDAAATLKDETFCRDVPVNTKSYTVCEKELAHSNLDSAKQGPCSAHNKNCRCCSCNRSRESSIRDLEDSPAIHEEIEPEITESFTSLKDVTEEYTTDDQEEYLMEPIPEASHSSVNLETDTEDADLISMDKQADLEDVENDDAASIKDSPSKIQRRSTINRSSRNLDRILETEEVAPLESLTKQRTSTISSLKELYKNESTVDHSSRNLSEKNDEPDDEKPKDTHASLEQATEQHSSRVTSLKSIHESPRRSKIESLKELYRKRSSLERSSKVMDAEGHSSIECTCAEVIEDEIGGTVCIPKSSKSSAASLKIKSDESRKSTIASLKELYKKRSSSDRSSRDHGEPSKHEVDTLEENEEAFADVAAHQKSATGSLKSATGSLKSKAESPRRSTIASLKDRSSRDHGEPSKHEVDELEENEEVFADVAAHQKSATGSLKSATGSLKSKAESPRRSTIASLKDRSSRDHGEPSKHEVDELEENEEVFADVAAHQKSATGSLKSKAESPRRSTIASLKDRSSRDHGEPSKHEVDELEENEEVFADVAAHQKSATGSLKSATGSLKSKAESPRRSTIASLKDRSSRDHGEPSKHEVDELEENEEVFADVAAHQKSATGSLKSATGSLKSKAESPRRSTIASLKDRSSRDHGEPSKHEVDELEENEEVFADVAAHQKSATGSLKSATGSLKSATGSLKSKAESPRRSTITSLKDLYKKRSSAIQSNKDLPIVAETEYEDTNEDAPANDRLSIKSLKESPRRSTISSLKELYKKHSSMYDSNKDFTTAADNDETPTTPPSSDEDHNKRSAEVLEHKKHIAGSEKEIANFDFAANRSGTKNVIHSSEQLTNIENEGEEHVKINEEIEVYERSVSIDQPSKDSELEISVAASCGGIHKDHLGKTSITYEADDDDIGKYYYSKMQSWESNDMLLCDCKNVEDTGSVKAALSKELSSHETQSARTSTDDNKLQEQPSLSDEKVKSSSEIVYCDVDTATSETGPQVADDHLESSSKLDQYKSQESQTGSLKLEATPITDNKEVSTTPEKSDLSLKNKSAETSCDSIKKKQMGSHTSSVKFEEDIVITTEPDLFSYDSVEPMQRKEQDPYRSPILSDDITDIPKPCTCDEVIKNLQSKIEALEKANNDEIIQNLLTKMNALEQICIQNKRNTFQKSQDVFYLTTQTREKPFDASNCVRDVKNVKPDKDLANGRETNLVLEKTASELLALSKSIQTSQHKLKEKEIQPDNDAIRNLHKQFKPTSHLSMEQEAELKILKVLLQSRLCSVCRNQIRSTSETVRVPQTSAAQDHIKKRPKCVKCFLINEQKLSYGRYPLHRDHAIRYQDSISKFKHTHNDSPGKTLYLTNKTSKLSLKKPKAIKEEKFDKPRPNRRNHWFLVLCKMCCCK